MKKHLGLRSMMAQAVEQVVERRQSLGNVLPATQQEAADKDGALLQELCFGVLRTFSQLEWVTQRLMERLMTDKQRIVCYPIMVDSYQLLHIRIPARVALAGIVEGVVVIKRPQLKGLINDVLRQSQRRQDELLAEFARSDLRFLHPSQLVKYIKGAHPQQREAVLKANNQWPPIQLRINRNHHVRDARLDLLTEADLAGFSYPDYPGVVHPETPAPVHALPGSDRGWVTTQDVSAQGCVNYLLPEDGEQTLNLCCVSGGKTIYILEAVPLANVAAIDMDGERLLRTYDNLEHLGTKAAAK